MRRLLQKLCETARPSAWKPPLMLMTAMLSFLSFGVFAQTDRIPVSDGAFSNGSSFTANGWSSSSGANNPWVPQNPKTP